MNSFWSKFQKLDGILLIVMFALAVYSYVAISAATHGRTSGVPPHILEKQLIFLGLGFAVWMLVSLIDYRVYLKAGIPFYLLAIALLLVVFKMPAVNGSHSWIPLGTASFQPSEFAKLGMVMVIAALLNRTERRGKFRWAVYLAVLAAFAVPFALTLKEPALGQAMVMGIMLMAMMLAYSRRTWLVVGIILLFLLTYLAMTQYPDQTVTLIHDLIRHHLLKTYQANRIIDWLTPNFHDMSSGYTINQTMIAVGSGQEFGEGIFHGVKTNGHWIPNQWNDFIFSAIGEETGFIGSSILLLTFMVLFYRLVSFESASTDTFGKYLIIGILGMFAFQVFENVGMNIDLMPITGITLPFISYGGSSLITNFAAIGICNSVVIHAGLPSDESNYDIPLGMGQRKKRYDALGI